MTTHYIKYFDELQDMNIEAWVDENNKLHNPDEVARRLINLKGTLILEGWYIHGVMHRDGDEPAATVYNSDGTVHHTAYYKDGRLHRECGPAWVPDNIPEEDVSKHVEEWWMNGRKFDIDDFAAFISLPKEEQVAIKLIN